MSTDQLLTLRSMKQAKYSAYSSMHFGLSTRYYCHFTLTEDICDLQIQTTDQKLVQ